VDPICDFLRDREITRGKELPGLMSLRRGSAIPALPRAGIGTIYPQTSITPAF